MRHFYLAALVVGAVTPFVFALKHFHAHGYSPLVFVERALVTPAATACFIDLCLSGLVFFVFAYVDTKRRRAPMKHVWISIALSIVGLVSTICYYLWTREISEERA